MIAIIIVKMHLKSVKRYAPTKSVSHKTSVSSSTDVIKHKTSNKKVYT